MNYKKINKVLMQILERKYDVKIDANIKMKEGETNENKQEKTKKDNIKSNAIHNMLSECGQAWLYLDLWQQQH